MIVLFDFHKIINTYSNMSVKDVLIYLIIYQLYQNSLQEEMKHLYMHDQIYLYLVSKDEINLFYLL